MVSNFERILKEIRNEAGNVAVAADLKPEFIVKLIMDIVDLEDRHRVKSVAGINKTIQGMIEDSACIEGRSENA